MINAKNDKGDNSVTITEATSVSKNVGLNDTSVDDSAGCHSITDGEVISLINSDSLLTNNDCILSAKKLKLDHKIYG